MDAEEFKLLLDTAEADVFNTGWSFRKLVFSMAKDHYKQLILAEQQEEWNEMAEDFTAYNDFNCDGV